MGETKRRSKLNGLISFNEQAATSSRNDSQPVIEIVSHRSSKPRGGRGSNNTTDANQQSTDGADANEDDPEAGLTDREPGPTKHEVQKSVVFNPTFKKLDIQQNIIAVQKVNRYSKYSLVQKRRRLMRQAELFSSIAASTAPGAAIIANSTSAAGDTVEQEDSPDAAAAVPSIKDAEDGRPRTRPSTTRGKLQDSMLGRRRHHINFSLANPNFNELRQSIQSKNQPDPISQGSSIHRRFHSIQVKAENTSSSLPRRDHDWRFQNQPVKVKRQLMQQLNPRTSIRHSINWETREAYTFTTNQEMMRSKRKNEFKLSKLKFYSNNEQVVRPPK